MADDFLRGIQINSKGFGTIPKIVMQDSRLDIAAKAIYAYLNSFAGSGDTCFPTVDRICRELNISKDRYSKNIKQLVLLGYIKVEQIKINGRFSHNVYTICETVSPCTDFPCTEKPYTENTVTVNSVYGKSDTNINTINNNNNIYKNNNNNIFVPTSKKFAKPTLEEVKDYCQERNNKVDPEKFFDYYEANGWVQGKGKPLKDWKAAVRTWERNSFNNGQQNDRKEQPSNPQEEERDIFSLPDEELTEQERIFKRLRC